jgi:pilus assembly protein CpaB
MRNKTALVMLIVALLMGLTAVVLAARWLGQRTAASTQKVVIAARDVQLGTALTAETLAVIDWPKTNVPQGASSEVAKLVGRTTRYNLAHNEPVLENRLAAIGTKGGLSAMISEGKRAVTVKVNEVVGVAGFALPGNYVDVMVHTTDEKVKRGDADQAVSKIVLERILVLAIAQESNPDATKPKVVSAVTLELTPQQAEKLDVARSVGTLSLVLRNQLDAKSEATGGARKNDLLQAKPEPVPAAPRRVAAVKPPPERHRVEMIKGTQRSAVEF